MKRLWLWLREFTLTQQLMAIVILVITVFASFLFTFLSPAINSFTTNEMYRMIYSSQTSMVFYLNSKPTAIPDYTITDDSGIIHAIYDTDTQEFMILGSSTLDGLLLDSVRTNLADMAGKTADYSYTAVNKSAGSSMLYTAARLNDGKLLVSFLPSIYETSFKTMLVNNIVNVNVIVAVILFLILMLWVTTLIIPLNQIRNYINRIRKDEPAVLNVSRRDEIGEVADAVRDMEDELQKQNREKQEMIQNISHDLKTPIATIRSYSESIKDGVYPYGTLEKSIDVIIEHADRLDKKVRSLITLNKMGYLQDSCEPGENLEMTAVIDKVLLSLKVIRPEVTFERVLDHDVKFHGDEDSWRIVVENLVDNALRYAKSLIRLELHTGELLVINDGRLIEKDRIGKLFKPYEKGTDGQFGLGLSIVYKIVSIYGYRVEAENLKDSVCFRVFRELTEDEKKEKQKEKKQEERKQLRETKEKHKEDRERQKEVNRVAKQKDSDDKKAAS
ncbi:MAG: HAMP domain-containing histidine kinase [Erysipelotrichia bacterium]|nr:HAMP domain-containing histidine kinase [Erysipelotrichia bacterium]